MRRTARKRATKSRPKTMYFYNASKSCDTMRQFSPRASSAKPAQGHWAPLPTTNSGIHLCHPGGTRSCSNTDDVFQMSEILVKLRLTSLDDKYLQVHQIGACGECSSNALLQSNRSTSADTSNGISSHYYYILTTLLEVYYVQILSTPKADAIDLRSQKIYQRVTQTLNATSRQLLVSNLRCINHLQGSLEVGRGEKAKADTVDLGQNVRQERPQPVVRKVEHLWPNGNAVQCVMLGVKRKMLCKSETLVRQSSI